MRLLQTARVPDEDEALRPAIQQFLSDNLPKRPSWVRARSWQAFDASFSRALGAAGWIGITLPRDYGGQGRSVFARFVVLEELLSAGAPVAAHWIADRQSAPLLMKFGSEQQRQRFIPAICRGECFFCIGMSEPGAGSDLASVRTRATRSDTGWILSGSKIWTTNADKAHFMIALARSSGTGSDRHKGLSQFIVDLSLPGVTIRPIEDLAGDRHFCEVHFEDVQLDEESLVGSEGSGWFQVVAELALERSGPERFYSSNVLIDEWIRELSEQSVDSSTTALVGQLTSELAVLRSMSLGIAASLAAGESPVAEASLVKDLGTSFEQRVPVLISQLLGSAPDHAWSEALRRTLDYVAAVAPSFSLRGGTREVLRGIIARDLLRSGLQ